MNDKQSTTNAPQPAGALLDELQALRRALSGNRGSLQERLGPLSLSISRLVEQLPLEDPLGLGERLLGALSDLSSALAQCPRPRSREQRVNRVRAKAAVAEAGYLATLCQEFGLGRPEQADSTVGRIDALAGALRT